MEEHLIAWSWILNNYKQDLAEKSDKELANLILLPGLSTAKEVTGVSGRGVGMDVVAACVEKLGGSLEISTKEFKGTTMLLRLPLTLAIIPSLLIRVDNYRFAIPQANLEELVCLYDDEIRAELESVGSQELFRLRQRLLPIVRLREILEHDEPLSEEDRLALMKSRQGSSETRKSLVFVVVKFGGDCFGLIVDEVLGTEEIVVKPMHPSLKGLDCYSGATVLGDGEVALILDVEGISKFSGITYHQVRNDETMDDQGKDDDSLSVLLFKSGLEEQFAIELSKITRVEHIQDSDIEKAGDQLFVNIDNIPTRVIKLNDYIPVSPCQESNEMFLILPKGGQPFGLLINSIINIQDVNNNLSEESFAHAGIIGSALVDNQMTLFVDINKVGQMALDCN